MYSSHPARLNNVLAILLQTCEHDFTKNDIIYRIAEFCKELVSKRVDKWLFSHGPCAKNSAIPDNRYLIFRAKTTSPIPLATCLSRETVEENTAKMTTNSYAGRHSASSLWLPPEQPNKCGGRHSKLIPIENLIIIREVAASKAHIAPYGKVRAKFEEVAENCNGNPMMPEKVNWNTFQDRYKRLQEWFDKEDNIKAKLSGVGGG